eukprot:TRINITY_DN295_c3_g1_i1.p1 TRINITY_DN295_c3_g1~~TRINITY_DN295_c3_g1_i1.p1  ORF type:complete len:829 (+),score=267.15 TRINITY_DN295_c3_g1_i1:73-2487(+)
MRACAVLCAALAVCAGTCTAVGNGDTWLKAENAAVEPAFVPEYVESDVRPNTPESRVAPPNAAEDHLPPGMGSIRKGWRRSWADRTTYPAGWFNVPNKDLGWSFPVGLKGPEWFESTGQGLVEKLRAVEGERSRWVRAQRFSLTIKSVTPLEIDSTPSDNKFFPAPYDSTVPQAFKDAFAAKPRGPDNVLEEISGWSDVRVECEPARSSLTVRQDICLLNYELKSHSSRSAEFPNLTTDKSRPIFRPDSPIKCDSESCLAAKRRGLLFYKTIAPAWTGDGAKIDFRDTRGRNAIQCTVVLYYRTTASIGAFADALIRKVRPPSGGRKEAVRVRTLGIFRVYPFDMMRERDAEGYVNVPVYRTNFLMERSRGWAQLTGVPFYMHTGKFGGWARVKLDLESSAPVRAPIVAPQMPEDPSRRPDWSKDIPALHRPGLCPLPFAHRGVSHPSDVENSVSMVRRAYERGIPGVEADVFLLPVHSVMPEYVGDLKKVPPRPSDDLADYRVVLAHDGNLRRSVGGTGHRDDSSSAGLYTESESAMSRFMSYTRMAQNGRYMHCDAVTTLGELLAELRKYPIMLNIDVKPNDPRVEPFKDYNLILGVKVGALVRKYNVEDRVIVSGFSSKTLLAVNDPRVGGRRIATGLSEFDLSMSGRLLGFYNAFKRGGLTDDVSVMHLERLADLRADKKKTVGVYTMYDFGVATKDSEGRDALQYSRKTLVDAVRKGVAWIETDDPIRLSIELHTVCDELKVPINWYPRSWAAVTGNNRLVTRYVDAVYDGDEPHKRGTLSAIAAIPEEEEEENEDRGR